MTLDANLTADPAMATAPATVTFTVNVTDPAGDAAWNLTLDGVEVGFGTEDDSPWSFNQTYDAAGNHTAVLTAWDGVETVRREVWVMVAAAEEPAA
jgi:YD repeat-containing protein